MNKIVPHSKLKTVIYIFFSLITSLLTLGYFYNQTNKNVLNNNSINKGVGWINNQSYYSGSELSFSFKNSNEISFKLTTHSKADQGIEIFIDDNSYFISSPNLNSQKLSIAVDKNKPHTVAVKHFCTYLFDPCQISLTGIYLESGAQITPYQKHSKIISVFGDSISTIYGRNNYSQILANDIGYELHNASIIQSSISNVPKVDNGIKRYKKDLMKFKSDTTIIFLGTNDAKENVDPEVFKDDYSKIVSDIKSFNPNGKIFLVGILHRKDLSDSTIWMYNEIIKEIAHTNNAYYIDTNNWLNDNDYADDIHPSYESQKKLADHLKQYIYPVLK